MAEPTVRGRFVWHELLTSDPAAAQHFYAGICGWQVEQWNEDPNYSMFVAANGPIGGVLHVADNAMGTGEQPKWLPYIAADDVDATVERAVSLGARVLQKSGATPGGGRYAVLADPQGACFGVYGSTATSPPAAQGVARGEFSWHELATTDSEAALKFYSALFGWEQLVQHDMGDEGPYRIFGVGGSQLGGIYNKPDGEPVWVSYVLVQNAAKSADHIKSAGGNIVMGPMQVPGGDWIAVAADPQGAVFAVHAYKAKSKARAAAAAEQDEASEAPVEVVESEPEKERKQAPKRRQTKKKQPAAKATSKKKAASASQRKTAKKTSAKKTSTKKTTKTKAKTTKRSAKKAAARKSAKKKSARSGARGKKVARRTTATAKAARKSKVARKKARRAK
jgi:predicted enzyme related to lactoylglutathione lyase